MTEPDLKLPPHSLDAEASLLASMMLDPIVADDALGRVGADWFYLADHAIVFHGIRSIREKGSPVDAVILRNWLKQHGQLEEIGGTAFIGQILNSVPSSAHWEEYLEIVREKYQYRQAITIADGLLRRAYKESGTAADVLNEAASAVANVVSNNQACHVMTADQLFSGVRDQLANPDYKKQFTSYGFPSLDKELIGIAPGELILIGARPSMGKSTIMRQMALMMALADVPVLYVSLEESASKVGRNVFSWLCGIENRRVRQGFGADGLTLKDIQKIDQHTTTLRNKPFYFVWGQRRADRIHSIAASYIARHGVKVVFVDYLQKVEAGGKPGDDYARATASSEAIAGMAREMSAGWIAAAQLNREVGKREDKRPTMTDLRSSGQIEQDADVIALLHREDYYHQTDPNYAPTRQAELILAKVRDGERGNIITLKSELSHQCFRDPMTRELYETDKIEF